MAAMVTSLAKVDGDQNPLKLQEIFIYLLLLALLLLIGFFMDIVFHYALPQPNLIVLGNLTDFSSSVEPYYFVSEKVHLYIVNIDGQLSAFDVHTPQFQRCQVRWVKPNHRFEDPCSGSKFAINGGYLEGPASGHLLRYPIRNLGDGKLYVDGWAPVVETKTEFIQRCLIALHSNAIPIENRIWGDEGDDQHCENFWEAVPRQDNVLPY